MMRKSLVRAVLVMTCAAVLGPSAFPQESSTGGKRLTPEQALNVRNLSDLHISPDGTRLAFVVTESVKGAAARARHVWMLDVHSRALRQFTTSSKSEDTPRWSPDGRTLAFLSDRDDNRHIFLISMDGGEARRLTEGKRNISWFAWSPDGKQIAFLAQEPRTEAEENKEKEKDDSRVVDKDERLARLWLLDVASGKLRQLTSGRWRINPGEWLPDGTGLIVSATDHPESEDERNKIYTVAVADGKFTELATPGRPFGALRISPDGKTIAYVASRGDGPSPHDLFLLSRASGVARNLTFHTLDRPVEGFQWRRDESLLAVTQDGFKTKMVAIATDGALKPFADLPVNPRAFDLAPTGTLAFVGVSATEPEELWLREGAGQPQRMSEFNRSWRQFALSKPEIIHFKSSDGLEIEAALLKPPGYQTGTKVPLVVLVHGGPTGAWSDSIESWGQLLAGRGFAILYPNIRGSTGYGERFVEMNRGDWGGGDFKDVMAGVDYLIKEGIADPNRLGIGGWSYGGYMAEWAVTQTTRFKAAVSGAGLSNLVSEYGTEVGPAYDRWFYGVPYENLDGFMKSSPVKYLKNARTPTLVLQGDADVTDPIGQSQELYRGLKHYGVESEFVVYPREGHGLREEKHLLDRLNRIVAWFEAHLK